MRILCVAPQPFHVERGTPIAVRWMVEALADLGHEVDLLTYHEGADVALRGVSHHRIAAPPGVRDVPIGPSWKKLVCDVWLARRMLRMATRGRHDVIHAGEEAAYLAYLLRSRLRIPYVVDMDSSIPQQLAERFPRVQGLFAPVARLDACCLRSAVAVTAVCENLATIARRAAPHVPVRVIRDMAILPPADASPTGRPLRAELGIPAQRPLVLYAGNLEPYQGIDLLLQAFARVNREGDLVLVGGGRQEAWRGRARDLGLAERVHWAGPRPLRDIGRLLREADVLVSPRVTGRNTPMKVYTYLASGVAIAATSIPAHVEVLDAETALLAPAEPAALANALRRLLDDEALRQRLGDEARRRALERFGPEAFARGVAELYRVVAARIGAA